VSSKLLFVSRPRFFGVKYDINPWMSENLDSVNRDLAIEQWKKLVGLLRNLGAEVRELECPEPGVPDVTFIANAGSFLLFNGKYVFIPARFRYEERMHEESFFIDQMEWAGAKVLVNPYGDVAFEGDGDLLRIWDTIVVGHGFRTSSKFVTGLEKKMPKKILPIKLIDPKFYHLDTCFFWHQYSGVNVCWYYPKAFMKQSLIELRKHLADRDIDAYEVSEKEAEQFCCNAVGLYNNIIADSFSVGLKKYITSRDFEFHETPLSEFKKAGGSAKCLTLEVPRLGIKS